MLLYLQLCLKKVKINHLINFFFAVIKTINVIEFCVLLIAVGFNKL